MTSVERRAPETGVPAVLRGVLALTIALLGIIAIGFFEIRADAASRGVSVDWSNNIESAGSYSAFWWNAGIVVVVLIVIAVVWPYARTLLSMVPPLVAGLVFGGSALWCHLTKEPGYVSIFETGQASSATGPVQAEADAALGQWFRTGALSAVTLILVAVMVLLISYALLRARDRAVHAD